MTSNTDDSDDLLDELTKSKEDIFGLEGTALGRAKKKKATEEEAAENKRAKLVARKILLKQAEREGLGDDSAVEALRADVHDMSNEIEAEALVAEQAEGETEAAEKIGELESLANSTEGAASASFQEKADALRAEHGWEEEPGKYDAEALVSDPDDLPDDPDAEALQEFQERKEAEQETLVRDEDLPEEAKSQLSMLKQMKSQASTDSIREIYEGKIAALRAEHSE